MKSPNRYSLIMILCLLFLPALLLANPVVPVPVGPNFPDFLRFISLFGMILLVEAGVLKGFIRDYPYLCHLRFAFYPNLISSVVGSAAFAILRMMSIHFYPFQLMPRLIDILLFGGFYLLAVCVEFPVIRYLYSKKISTCRALYVSAVMNLATYLILLKIYIYLGADQTYTYGTAL